MVLSKFFFFSFFFQTPPTYGGLRGRVVNKLTFNALNRCHLTAMGSSLAGHMRDKLSGSFSRGSPFFAPTTD